MIGKVYIIGYVISLVISIGLIIVGSVLYSNLIRKSITNRLELSKDNQKYWSNGPYGQALSNKINITLFEWTNSKDLNSNNKVAVKEVDLPFLIDEKINYQEISRKDVTPLPNVNQEILTMKVNYDRTVKEDDNAAVEAKIFNIGAIKLWEYIKNSKEGIHSIKFLYRQLKAIEDYFYLNLKQMLLEKITTTDEFVKIFDKVDLDQTVKSNMYNKYKMSFKRADDFSFLEVLYECNRNPTNDKPTHEDLGLRQKCNLFDTLYGSSKLTEIQNYFLNYVKTTFPEIATDKYTYTREQWGSGKFSQDASVFGTNITLFKQELFFYAKEKFPDKKLSLSDVKTKKLIDYSFVLKNDKDPNYIAEDKDKSSLFDKEKIDELYVNFKNKVDTDLKAGLTEDESSIVQHYIADYLFVNDPKDTTKKNLMTLELSEFVSGIFYYLSSDIGQEYFYQLVAQQALDEKFIKEDCNKIFTLLEVGQRKKICDAFNNFNNRQIVKSVIEATYFTNLDIETKISEILEKQERENFYSQFKSIIDGYIEENAISVVKDSFTHYLEIDFTKFGALQLFLAEYKANEKLGFKTLSDISDKFKLNKDFNQYVTELGLVNPLTRIDIEGNSNFSGLFSIDFLYKKIIENSGGIKEKGFNTDTFINYIREIYVEHYFQGLTKKVTLDNNNFSSYIDSTLTFRKQRSILLGGDRAIEDKIYLIFPHEEFLDNRISLYSGKGDISQVRKFSSLTGENNLDGELVVKRRYYPGNNQPVKEKFESIGTNFKETNSLSATDGFVFPGKISTNGDYNKKEFKNCFFNSELLTKLYFNKGGSSGDFKALNYDSFDYSYETQFKENPTSSLYDKDIITYNTPFNYPLISSMKYFFLNEYNKTVSFTNKTAEIKLEDIKFQDDLNSTSILEPDSGLTVHSKLNFMYSIRIQPDLLFNIPSTKVIPIFHKRRSYDANKKDIVSFLDVLLQNLFASSLFSFFGVGLLTFSLCMLVFAIFRPKVDDENSDRKYDSNALSYESNSSDRKDERLNDA